MYARKKKKCILSSKVVKIFIFIYFIYFSYDGVSNKEGKSQYLFIFMSGTASDCQNLFQFTSTIHCKQKKHANNVLKMPILAHTCAFLRKYAKTYANMLK